MSEHYSDKPNEEDSSDRIAGAKGGVQGGGFAVNRYLGRRSSGKLSAAKRSQLDTLLAKIRLPERVFSSRADLCSAFGGASDAQHLVLEVGFGGGENLIAAAKSADSDTAWVGCEVFRNGIATTVRGLHEAGIANVRIADRDIEQLFEQLPADSFDQIVVLFPDPWPKARHRKRRIYADGRLAGFHKLLRAGGTFQIASDIAAYIEDFLLEVADTSERGRRWKIERHDHGPRPEGLLVTRYYQKGIDAGRAVQLVKLQKVPTGG